MDQNGIWLLEDNEMNVAIKVHMKTISALVKQCEIRILRILNIEESKSDNPRVIQEKEILQSEIKLFHQLISKEFRLIRSRLDKFDQDDDIERI